MVLDSICLLGSLQHNCVCWHPRVVTYMDIIKRKSSTLGWAINIFIVVMRMLDNSTVSVLVYVPSSAASCALDVCQCCLHGGRFQIKEMSQNACTMLAETSPIKYGRRKVALSSPPRPPVVVCQFCTQHSLNCVPLTVNH